MKTQQNILVSELIIPHYFNSHQQLDNPFPKWNKSYKIKKLKENTKTTFISLYICHNLYSQLNSNFLMGYLLFYVNLSICENK